MKRLKILSIITVLLLGLLVANNVCYAADTTPPTPNPPTWKVYPMMGVTGNYRWLYMEANTVSDPNAPAWYYFDCVNGYAPDSGWQLSPIYTFFQGSHAVYVVRTKDNVGNVSSNSIPWYSGD